MPRDHLQAGGGAEPERLPQVRLPLPDPRHGADPRRDRRGDLRRVRAGTGVGGRTELRGHQEIRRPPQGGDEEDAAERSGRDGEGEDQRDRHPAGRPRLRVPGRLDGKRGGGEGRHRRGNRTGGAPPSDHLQLLRGSPDAGRGSFPDADGQDERCTGAALRCPHPVHQCPDRPYYRRRGREFRHAGGRDHLGTRRARRVRGSARHRADDQAEAAGRVPARGISPRARDDGHDRREEPAQADPDADPAVSLERRGSMTRVPGPSGPETVRKGLSRMRAALARSGHPERAFRTLHVAGTNGKGSTACFLEAILRQVSGGRVGLYTSPHLLSPEERIRVDGQEISRRALRAGFRAAPRLGRPGGPLTYFETMTWVACDWFRRMGVSLAVMETGLGGRWDATTACQPLVSVITTVGVDHREWLGNTLGEIAREKAGILKAGIPVVTGRIRPSARAVIRRRARSLGCPVWELDSE